ncbi:hypothetical protein [Brevundimonas pishanensis]|uniref:hypothetical protein n=1 Tax=Brevundimonas pishanensis TaxID=2896315 RepID=UPI001FA7CE1F|nr:hypothetical protein [Brevundimonas pishanensis]
MIRSLIRSGLTTVSLAVLSAACAPVVTSAVALNEPGRVEPIYAAAVAGNVAVIRVGSNGCTSKSDLIPHLSRGVGQAVLTVRRTQMDTCSAPEREGLELQWTFEELGLPSGTLLMVNNPLRSDTIVAGQP